MPLYNYRSAMLRVLMEPADNEGAPGGGGGADDDLKPGELKPGEQKPGPTDAEAKLLKESMKRKAELDDLKKKYDGIDPEEYKRLRDAEAKRKDDEAAEETKRAEAAGEYERVKRSMSEQHQKQLADLQKQIDAANAEKEAKGRENDELTVGRAFGDSSFITEKLTYTPRSMRQLYGSHFENVNGKAVGYDKPRGASDRTMLVDANGEPISFDAAIQKIVDADPDKDKMYRAAGAPGAGGQQNRHKPGPVEITPGSSRIAAALKKLNK